MAIKYLYTHFVFLNNHFSAENHKLIIATVSCNIVGHFSASKANGPRWPPRVNCNEASEMHVFESRTRKLCVTDFFEVLHNNGKICSTGRRMIRKTSHRDTFFKRPTRSFSLS